MLLAAASLLWACSALPWPAEVEPPAPQPPAPLPAQRWWLGRDLSGAEQILAVRTARRAALAFAVDPAAGRVHLLDEVLGHDARPRCLPEASAEPASASMPLRGACGEGQVAVHRGYVELPAPVDVAVDEEGMVAWIASAEGALYAVTLDPWATTPSDWLAIGPPTPLGRTLTSLAWVDGSLWATSDTELLNLSGATVIASHRIAGGVLVQGADAPWVLGPQGLWTPGRAGIPASLAAGGGGVLAWWHEGRLRWSTGEDVAFTEAPVALALDPRSHAAWLIVDRSLHRVTPTGDHQQTPVRAGAETLALTWTHDVLVAGGDRVDLYVDEAALLDPDLPPLRLLHLSFLERPASPDEDLPCAGEDRSMERYIARARSNLALLRALPGKGGLGITPRYAEVLDGCGLVASLVPFLALPDWEPGFMFHQEHDCATVACLHALLVQRGTRLAAVGAAPTWATGLHNPGEPAGPDWVEAALRADIDRLLFFGVDVLPGVEDGDPRNRQPWPSPPGDETPACRLEHLTDLERADTSLLSPVDAGFALPNGQGCACAEEAPHLAAYPGNAVRAGAVGSCPGLLFAECFDLLGGAQPIEAVDARALALLARHAAARRTENLHTWTWHLPDLNQQDYLEGCTGSPPDELEGSCPAQQVLALGGELDALVAAGVAEWALPSELPR